MRKTAAFLLFCVTMILLSTSCQRSSGQTWEDMKTAGRYIGRSFDTLFGKEYDSCLLESDDEFIGPDDEDFIPLSDKDIRMQYRATDTAVRQPKLSPGEKGSGIPGIDRFQDPSARLNSIFKMIHFETDDHIVRTREDLVGIQKIANYLKKNPTAYLCVEGHCDQRASAAYNMALGTRRANHIRVLLIKQGVDFNRIYTISHGKEKPIALGHSPEDWRQNRRAQFKIYHKK